MFWVQEFVSDYEESLPDEEETREWTVLLQSKVCSWLAVRALPKEKNGGDKEI